MIEAAAEQFQEQVQGTEEQKPDAVEERAAGMGWVPKEKFRGDPEKWVDASRFVERAEKELPIALGHIKRQDKKIADLQTMLTDVQGMLARREQRGYDRAMSDLKRQREEAVELGDKDKFNQVEKQMKDLEKDAPKTTPKQEQDALSPDEIKEVHKWADGNVLFRTDPDYQAFITGVCESLAKSRPELRGVNQLREAEKLARKAFPEKFSNPEREKPGAVVSGGGEDGGGKRGKGHSYNDLPADAKAACDAWVNQKLLTRDQYIKEYFGE